MCKRKEKQNVFWKSIILPPRGNYLGFLCMLFWCILCVCCCDGLDRGVETVCIGVCVCVLCKHDRGGSAQTVWSCLVGVRNSTFHSVTRCEQLSVSLNVYENHNLLMTTLIVFNAGRSVEWCDTFCLLHRKTTLFPSIILYYILFYFLSPLQ